MLFGKNEPPFSDNSACKNCLLKPCKTLLSGNLYPGKVTFIRRSDFMTLPCYTPSWRKDGNAAAAEPAALTDDLVVVRGPVTVKNPRWEHKDNGKKESSPDVATFGDNVILMADLTGIPEGASMTFDIYDTSEEPPMVAGSARGKNVQGVAKGEWVVTDKSGKGAEAKLAFEAIAKSKASEKCEIKLSEENIWGICRTHDETPLALRKFLIVKNNEVVHTGTTDKDGNVKVPFEYTSEYQFCVEDK